MEEGDDVFQKNMQLDRNVNMIEAQEANKKHFFLPEQLELSC